MRLWDLNTELPLHTCEGHKDHVLFVAFSPDSKVVASGGMDKVIYLWESETGSRIGNPLRGHSKFVTSIAWQPMIA
jgi:ribosome assembly protein 4